jgi:hypothetical protein
MLKIGSGGEINPTGEVRLTRKRDVAIASNSGPIE